MDPMGRFLKDLTKIIELQWQSNESKLPNFKNKKKIWK